MPESVLIFWYEFTVFCTTEVLVVEHRNTIRVSVLYYYNNTRIERYVTACEWASFYVSVPSYLVVHWQIFSCSYVIGPPVSSRIIIVTLCSEWVTKSQNEKIFLNFRKMHTLLYIASCLYDTLSYRSNIVIPKELFTAGW